MPSAMSSFNVDDSTASVIFPISFRKTLYRSGACAASTQIIRDFHFPPKIASPYSQRTANIFFHFGLIHEPFLLSGLILFSTSHFPFHSYLDFPSSQFSQKAGTGIAAHTGFCYCLFKRSMLIQHLRLLLRLRAEHAWKC